MRSKVGDLNLRSTMIERLLIEIQRKKMEYRIAGISGFGEVVVNLILDISDDDGKQQLVLMDELVLTIKRSVLTSINLREQRVHAST